MEWNSFKVAFANFFSASGVAIFKSIIIFVIGYLIIKGALKVLSRILTKAKIEKSARKFVFNLVKYLLYFLLVMIIVSELGVSITGFVAVFSALGLAVSLALQGSLSNLANGIVILISKPFKEGDLVSIDGFDGVIKEVTLTHTVLVGSDSRQISIPNKLVVEKVLLNSSVLEQKQIRYNFLVAYSTDIEKVKKIIGNSFTKTNYVLLNPSPNVVVEALEKDGVKLLATCFVESKNYSKVYSPLLEDIFNSLKREKIVLPHAQLQVRLQEENETLPFYSGTKLENKTEPAVAKKQSAAKKEVKQAPVPEPQEKDYLDYVVDEEVEITLDDEDGDDVETLRAASESAEKKTGFASKLIQKIGSKEKDKDGKKPKIIIKKK